MKKILILITLLLNVSCFNLNFFNTSPHKLSLLSELKREEKIIKIYNTLDKKYYKMLEDVIEEGELKKLEKEYTILQNEILKINDSNSSEKHLKFLNKYKKDIQLKLQYLKDLN